MYGNNRKTIGVFVTQVYQEFQDLTGRGICSRAKELGYNVAFFSNFVGYGELEYEKGELIMADLPIYEELAGIIIMPDTMFVSGFEKRIKENINNRCKCPVVSVRQKTEGYYNVLIDDNYVLEEIIRHFIEVHGFKKINFLAGPKHKIVSNMRLNTYKRILQEYNIPIEEERIFYGDFWRNKPYEAIDYWYSKEEWIPEAIICANDYMAMTVCNALADKGLYVPRDVAVSGCDNISISLDYSPPITTVGIPMFEMGIAAVDKIHMHNMGMEQDNITYMQTVTHIRESCGCKMSESLEAISARRNRIIYEVEDKDKAISNIAYMSIALTGVNMMEALGAKLGSYVYMNSGFTSFYLCLCKGWDNIQKDTNVDNSFDLDDMVMEVGQKNGIWLQREIFSRKDLLPPTYLSEEPQFFFFNMLYHQDKLFGYTAISFEDNKAYQQSYQGWLINVCNALENIRVHSEMNLLFYTLEDMYIKDELTGIYNRRGLVNLGQQYLDQSKENKNRLMIFTVDMDRLKYINDNFGHTGGDRAIKVVAEAMQFAAEDDELCIRLGGDEFAVIGLDYDEKKLKRFVTQFENEISRFNSENRYGFSVNVSFGWYMSIPNKNTTLEDCLIIADSKMYQQKNEKRMSGQ